MAHPMMYEDTGRIAFHATKILLSLPDEIFCKYSNFWRCY